MTDNNILIDFRFSKTKISQFLQNQIDNLPEKRLHTDGFDITLRRIENQNIKINAVNKSVFAELPIEFKFIKPAGLFSIEGEGSLCLRMKITFDIDQQFLLKTKSLLDGFEWIKEPVLHVGELDIPVETISNCVISYFKGDILEKLDDTISSKSEIKKLIKQQINKFGNNFLIRKKPDLFFNFELIQVQADVIKEDMDDIHINLWVEISSKVTDEPLKFEIINDPGFNWLDKRPKRNIQKIDVEISYNGLAKTILNEINGKEIGGKTFDLESIHIRYTTFLEIKASLLEPMKGIITITCQPYLDREKQLIYAGDLDIDIDAKNIIYKLSSPILEKIIRSRVESFLPFDPKPYFGDFLKNIPVIDLFDNQILLQVKTNKIFIDNFSFLAQHVFCSLDVENAELDVTL